MSAQITGSAKPRTRAANGESSIFYSETDERWHGWVTVGIKSDGSPDRRHRKGKDFAAVQEEVRKLERQRDSGKAVKAGRPPKLTDWLNTYFDTTCALAVRNGKMAPRTLDDYRSKARNWIMPLLGQHRIDRLRVEHLEAAYTTMQDEGLASSTVVKIHRIISRALKIAMRTWLSENVATLVEMSGIEQPQITPYSRPEARRILDTIAGRRNEARWSTALALGIRQGEALGLRWQHIVAICLNCRYELPFRKAPERCQECGSDFRIEIRAWFQVQPVPYEHGCKNPEACSKPHHKVKCRSNCKKHAHLATCRKGCKKAGHRCITRGCPKGCKGHAAMCTARTGGGWTFRERKGKRKLTLTCPPVLVPQLRMHLKRQAAQRLRQGDAWVDYDLVFCGRFGQPVGRSEDWRQWKAICADAGVRAGRVHDARHTCASLLVEQGVHLRVVQEILGHAHIRTTEQYAHVDSPLAADATAQLAEVLYG